MQIFEGSKWIWARDGAEPDEYAEFVEDVSFFGRKAELYISSDSNYTVYVNGALAAFGQYSDFPYKKVYDVIDLSRFMRQGRNVIAFRVWYYGVESSSTYYPGKASLIYKLLADGVTLAVSSERTPSRLSPTYAMHKCKWITPQLGLSFEYDSRVADAWMLGMPDPVYPFSASTVVDIAPEMRPRTCLRTELGRTHVGREVTGNGIKAVSPHGRIFDLGSEAVGFICLEFKTDSDSPVTVTFGEHLVDYRSHTFGVVLHFVAQLTCRE
jgi:hypothetical protein